MTNIVKIVGREILDSRGNPTVEAEVMSGRRQHGPRGCSLGRIYRRA